MRADSAPPRSQATSRSPALLGLRGTVITKAPLRVQFLLTVFLGRGEEQEALALLSKKGEGGFL